MLETATEEQSTKSTETFEHVVKLLEDSRAGLEQALAGLPDEFCSKKPADGGWSITEVVEHLTILEERVPRLLQAKLPGQELASNLSNARDKDDEFVGRISAYTAKINAPDVTKPTGRYESCRQALDEIKVARQRTLDYMASATPYLRGRLLPHPLLGPLDGCQWLLALAAHMQRHVKQIDGIKAALRHEPNSSH